MSQGFLDRVVFFPTTGGLTDWIVNIAVSGYQTPATAGAIDGETYRYFAESSDKSQWEIWEGTYTVSSATLARTTIVASSSGSKVNFTTTPNVTICTRSLDAFYAQGGYGHGPLINGQVKVTVSSNNVTFAIKT